MSGKYPPLCGTYISDIKNRITEKETHEVNADQASENPSICIDVRDLNEWEEGHLPNALHIPRSKLEFQIEKHIEDTAQPLILYCGGGGRSALAANTLLQMGYTHVSSMTGGYRAWVANDNPRIKDVA